MDNQYPKYNDFEDTVFTRSQKELFEALEGDIFPLLSSRLTKAVSPRYFAMATSEDPVTRAEILLPRENKHFRDSPYYSIPSTAYLHFTSIKSLISIIKSRAFWMFNLPHSNDPNELTEAAKCFNWGDEHLRVLKRQIFTFSMCKPYPAGKDFSIDHGYDGVWKEYGDDRKGCALILSLHGSPNDWYSYHLAPIYYDQFGYFDEISAKLKRFNNKFPEVYLDLPVLFSFHKTIKYRYENEIRLMYHSSYDRNNDIPSPVRSINFSNDYSLPRICNLDNDTVSHYLELPLKYPKASQEIIQYQRNVPSFQIQGVILGEAIRSNAASEIEREVIDLAVTYLGIDLQNKIFHMTS